MSRYYITVPERTARFSIYPAAAELTSKSPSLPGRVGRERTSPSVPGSRHPPLRAAAHRRPGHREPGRQGMPRVKTDERLNDSINVPVPRSLKRRVIALAKRLDGKPAHTKFTRILI